MFSDQYMYLLLLSAFVCTLFISALLFHWHFSPSKRKWIRDCRRVLFVIAHPDDECLFFGPTILALTQLGQCDVHLLCLSSGDYLGLGSHRKVELKRSCGVLGISANHVTVVQHTKLPDSPTVAWDKNILKDIILRYVEQLGIDTLLTFDQYGISGHANHIAIFYAIQHLYDKGKFPVNTQIFVLDSVSLIRKYMGIFDALLSCWTSSYSYVSSMSHLHLARRSMFQHRSQLVWFRVLYLLFSRYMCVNTYRRISMSKNFYKYKGSGAKKVRSATPS